MFVGKLTSHMIKVSIYQHAHRPLVIALGLCEAAGYSNVASTRQCVPPVLAPNEASGVLQAPWSTESTGWHITISRGAVVPSVFTPSRPSSIGWVGSCSNRWGDWIHGNWVARVSSRLHCARVLYLHLAALSTHLFYIQLIRQDEVCLLWADLWWQTWWGLFEAVWQLITSTMKSN